MLEPELQEQVAAFLARCPEGASASELLSLHASIKGNTEVSDAIIAELYLRNRGRSKDGSLDSFLQEVDWLSASLSERIHAINSHSPTSSGPTSTGTFLAFPEVGSVLDDIQLVRLLAVGAFSRVYLGADHRLGGRRIIVKVYHASETERAITGHFATHMRSVFLGCHIDIRTGMDILTMEFVGTQTLHDAIRHRHLLRETTTQSSGQRRDSSTEPDWVLDAAIDIASSVAVLHENGVLHMDIKPANILCDRSGRCTVIDFSLALPIVKTALIGFRGTLPYAAPELLRAAKHASLPDHPPGFTSDIYSIGLVLYELRNGRSPFTIHSNGLLAERAEDLLLQGRELESRLSASTHEPHAGLDYVMSRCLRVNESERFRDARELLDALHKCRGARGASKRVPWRVANKLSARVMTALGLSLPLSLCSVAALWMSPFGSRHHDTLHESATPRSVGVSVGEAPDLGDQSDRDTRSAQEVGTILPTALIEGSRSIKNGRRTAHEMVEPELLPPSVSREVREYIHFQSGLYRPASDFVGVNEEWAAVPDNTLFIAAVSEYMSAMRSHRSVDRTAFKELSLRPHGEELAALAVAFVNKEYGRASRGRSRVTPLTYADIASSEILAKVNSLETLGLFDVYEERTRLPSMEALRKYGY